jgi:ABC-2 type transport system permease protein
MNLRVIGVLLRKELRQGASNFFFTYAIIMPIALSLLVGLVFGDLFSQTPRLGVVDAGASAMTTWLQAQPQIEVSLYATEPALREAVERGSVTAGVILPAGLDARQTSQVTVLYWSESLAKDIAVIDSALDQAAAQITNAEPRITIRDVQLGAALPPTWSERLLPVIVLMTIVLGGVMVPSASLVDEKQKRTLSALTMSPASLFEVYIAKALLGMTLGTAMGIIVLVLNNAFGGQPGLLILTLIMGAAASSLFGVILGSLISSINALLAVVKTLGLVLFAPALIQLIPDVPAWIARVFPTYYVMNPVLEVSQRGASLADIGGELVILLAIIGAMLLVLALLMERQQQRLALAA